MTSQKLRVLGVDPGTIKTGYGLIAYDEWSGKMQPLDYGRILIHEKLSLQDRYKVLFTEMQKIILDLHPDIVSIETQFVKINVQSALKLGMAKGVILLASALAELSVCEYSPTEAKKAVVGKGHALKQQVQFMVSRILGIPELLKEDQEDQADAFALAICHIQNCSRNKLLKRCIDHV